MVADGQELWWIDNSSGGSIYRADLVGSKLVHRRTALDVPDVQGLDAIALDADHFYWIAEPQGNGSLVIGRAMRNGTDVETNLIATNSLEAASLQLANGYIYWGGDGNIGRARVNGSDVNPGFISGLFEGSPTSLLAHDGYIYWTGERTIGRVGMDGTHYKPKFLTVSGGLGQAQQSIYGLATDGRYLYWGSYGEPAGHQPPGGGIGRALLDGSRIDQTFISGPRVEGVMSLATAPAY
jgi:hypothetical protein